MAQIMEQGDPADCHGDWSLLPPDLTVFILTTLELRDQLAAAAVCRGWRAAYKADPQLDATPLFRAPCLVFHAGDDPAASQTTATLRTLADDGGGRRVHYRVVLPDPPFATRHVVGSAHGWLATADGSSDDLLLVNPVTRAQVRLPPIGNNLPIFPSFTTPDERRSSVYRKVVWSSDPTSGNCIVMTIHARHDNTMISFATVGDARWTLLDEEDFCRDYDDLFYSGEDGLLYAIRANNDVHAINLHAPFPTVKLIFKPKLTVRPPVEDDKYIARAPWGDIIRVSWCHDYDKDDAYLRTSKLVVYRMDCALRRVVKVKDLRGHALFIGLNNSFFFFPPTDESSVIKQDHVYHAEDLIDDDHICRIGAHLQPRPRHMVEVSLKDGSVNDVWPYPNFWSYWPPPVWLTPTFSQ